MFSSAQPFKRLTLIGFYPIGGKSECAMAFLRTFNASGRELFQIKGGLQLW